MESAEAVKWRMLEGGIKPHAEQIVQIAAEGDAAVVVWEPREVVKPALRAAGWDGKAAVFRMSPMFRKRFAKNCDAVSAGWLANDSGPERTVKVFLFAQGATFLLNWTRARGFYFQPGSLD